MAATTRRKPKLAVWKFASCDGCQLSLLDCEDELLALAGKIDIAYFPEASRRMMAGPYDLSLVEGSITTPADAERILRVRRRSRRLVTIGACATAGGIQALRNFADVREFAAAVYPHPEYLNTLATSTPISAHVPVDFELRGCPIDKGQLLEVIKAFLAGRKPSIADHSVCIDCKRRGNVCVMVAHGTPCLGPVTHSGCGAICPSYDRGCYGCFGPVDGANTAAIARRIRVARHGAPRHRPGIPALSTPPPRRSAKRPRSMANRTLRVDYIARVEGESSLDLQIRDGKVERVRLSIFEPPRFFEALLRGRGFGEVLDIVARICGICPIAYQMSGVHAIEDALGIVVDPPTRALRRLLYCGEWIESHALHIVMLHAPDFLGYPDGIAMARDHSDAVRRGLALKKAGNELLTLLGGRAIHPVNVRVGGFYRVPSRREFAPVAESLKHARDLAIATLRWAATFSFPDITRRLRVRRPAPSRRIPDEWRADRVLGRSRHCRCRLRNRVSPAPGTVFNGAAFGAATARRLSRRTDGALCA